MNKSNLGRNIRMYRNAKGLTQARLAEKVEVESSYISLVETGKKGISIDKFVLIANALNVSADSLLRGAITCEKENTNDDIARALSLSEDSALILELVFAIVGVLKNHKQK